MNLKPALVAAASSSRATSAEAVVWSTKTAPFFMPAKAPSGPIVTARRSLSLPTQHITKSWPSAAARSEEHTSELQSPCNLVCRLLLEKKKKHKQASMKLHRPALRVCRLTMSAPALAVLCTWSHGYARSRSYISTIFYEAPLLASGRML